jgi:hypothetical protein
MDPAVRAVLIALVALTAACGPRTEQASAPTDARTLATLYPGTTAVVEPSPTVTPVAIASATAAPSSPSASQTPSPQTTTRPPTPTAPPSSAAPPVGPLPTPSATPAQTRVPNSDALPTPNGLPATDGCLTYGAQPPYVSFVDCVVHGLPPAAAVTLTANGEVVFLRIGSTVVFPDGTWYFPWSESQHKEIVFVVTAGGVSRSITQVFR